MTDQQFTEEDVQRIAEIIRTRRWTTFVAEDGYLSAGQSDDTDVARAVLAALVEDGWRKRPVLSEEDWASLRDEGPVLAQRAAEIAVRLCPRCGGDQHVG